MKMSDNLTKKVLTIKGMPSNKKVIKFSDATENQLEDKWYETDAKVQALDLSKFGIVSGARVEVSFDESMKVVFIKSQKATQTEQKQEEKPVEQPKQVQQAPKVIEECPKEVKEMVIEAVSKDKKFIKFVDDTEKWRNASPEVMALDYEAIGLKKGNKALVTLDGKTIVTIIVQKEVVQEIVSESTNYVENSKTNNIDRQSAVKSSAEIIKSLIDAGIIKTVEEADMALRKLSRTATELIG
jgi:hypothetical protein